MNKTQDENSQNSDGENLPDIGWESLSQTPIPSKAREPTRLSVRKSLIKTPIMKKTSNRTPLASKDLNQRKEIVKQVLSEESKPERTPVQVKQQTAHHPFFDLNNNKVAARRSSLFNSNQENMIDVSSLSQLSPDSLKERGKLFAEKYNNHENSVIVDESYLDNDEDTDDTSVSDKTVNLRPDLMMPSSNSSMDVKKEVMDESTRLKELAQAQELDRLQQLARAELAARQKAQQAAPRPLTGADLTKLKKIAKHNVVSKLTGPINQQELNRLIQVKFHELIQQHQNSKLNIEQEKGAIINDPNQLNIQYDEESDLIPTELYTTYEPKKGLYFETKYLSIH